MEQGRDGIAHRSGGACRAMRNLRFSGSFGVAMAGGRRNPSRRMLVRIGKKRPVAKKLTNLIDDALWEVLHRVVGRGGISKFIENLARARRAARPKPRIPGGC